MRKWALLLMMTPLMAACTKRGVTAPEVETDAAAQARAEAGEGGVQIGAEFGPLSGLETVYFDTNKDEMREDARAALKRNAARLKAVLSVAPDAQFQVEGHCDERNTLEYNMALGQRRANRVRDYYVYLGIKRSALRTVSYGEEKPVCGEGEESCWQRNRRSETLVRAPSGPVKMPK